MNLFRSIYEAYSIKSWKTDITAIPNVYMPTSPRYAYLMQFNSVLYAYFFTLSLYYVICNENLGFSCRLLLLLKPCPHFIPVTFLIHSCGHNNFSKISTAHMCCCITYVMLDISLLIAKLFIVQVALILIYVKILWTFI